VPTTYIEPFGNVAVEAQGCGTPVISTDWGAMTETVEHGKTGFRCRMLSEFVEAATKVDQLDYAYIRERAQRLYSLETIAERYDRYFRRLLTLWDRGWYA
jgi:glycosyltransferase involved in cell wall biosynthesis